MSGDAHANKLEQWFSGLPQLVQEVLREPFSWMNDSLKTVAGQPEELVAAGARYTELAVVVQRIGQEQLSARQALAGRWTGEAYDAFTGKMGEFEAQLANLGETIANVKELLDAGADACVEAANMIIDLVTSLIMFALTTIAVNVALSFVTFGTSLAAGVALVAARALTALAKVARVVEKLASVLTKLAQMFVKLQGLLKRVAEVLKQIQTVLKESKALIKASQGWKAKLGAQASFSVQQTVVVQGLKYGTGGLIEIPGAVGGLHKSGNSYLDGWQDASEAQDGARRP